MLASSETRNLRIVFAGTPVFAAAHLEALLLSDMTVVSAYSQPDRQKGRGKKLLPPPVKEMALANEIPVFQPENFHSGPAVEGLRQQQPDLMIVVAYGLILPPSVLAIPKYGCLNVHASLLPRWRGAAPIERAILAGDTETGVCIMQMEAGLDSGPVLMRSSTAIQPDDTGESLGLRLQEMGRSLLVEALEALVIDKLHPEPQDKSLVTYAPKITREDALIHWDAPATVVNRQVRALIPRYPAYTWYAGDRLRILAADQLESSLAAPPGTLLEVQRNGLLVACGDDTFIRITAVQPEGKRAMSIASLLNGHPDYFLPDTSFSALPDHA